MTAADDAYARLLAAQRVVTKHELEELDREDKREKQQLRIKRKLPQVY